MANALAYVLDGGIQQILSGSAGLESYSPYSFKVGDQALFVPDTDETQPRGTIVYTGDTTLMQARKVSASEVRFSFIIPEGAGPFNIGNCVMYTMDATGIPTPFAMIVLPFVIPKKVAAYDTGTVGLAVPGNRLLINFTLSQQIATNPGSTVAVTVQVISPQYSNLSYYDTDSNLPAGELMPWNQFILQRSDLTGGPAFVTKDANNQYWVTPFFHDLHSPLYDVLGGGTAGDNYSQDDFPVLWGHKLSTNNALYRSKIGGAPIKYAGSALNSVGGAPIKIPQQG